MSSWTIVLIAVVAFLHVGFLILEMFLWTGPVGLRLFRMSSEKAAYTRTLAINQGLYNGFLAAGLIIALLLGDVAQARLFARFFLVCVVVAGVSGAVTVSRRILFVQALPAVLALLALETTG